MVGERAGSPPDEGSDTTTPTVLLHASYGGGAAAVPEHAIWDGTSGFPAAWDLEAHAASPDPTAAASTDVGIGAAVAIAAIKSLLSPFASQPNGLCVRRWRDARPTRWQS